MEVSGSILGGLQGLQVPATLCRRSLALLGGRIGENAHGKQQLHDATLKSDLPAVPETACSRRRAIHKRRMARQAAGRRFHRPAVSAILLRLQNLGAPSPQISV